MVGGSLPTMEWQDSRETVSGHGDRCIKEGLGGPWSRSESNMHINCLEALAAFLAIKCFTRDCKSVTILLRMDNMSAITYVNKLGGTISQNLTAIIKKLALMPAEHLPGVQNVITDKESCVMKDKTDWKLNSEVFRQINR